mmetsp:Transcript_50477/g.141280  ORF Transcript_50477/g.141280 Transcript_50477/m.141280 type:complete len:208 (+) Transcript_50477:886-1509(+)
MVDVAGGNALSVHRLHFGVRALDEVQLHVAEPKPIARRREVRPVKLLGTQNVHVEPARPLRILADARDVVHLDKQALQAWLVHVLCDGLGEANTPLRANPVQHIELLLQIRDFFLHVELRHKRLNRDHAVLSAEGVGERLQANIVPMPARVETLQNVLKLRGVDAVPSRDPPDFREQLILGLSHRCSQPVARSPAKQTQATTWPETA